MINERLMMIQPQIGIQAKEKFQFEMNEDENERSVLFFGHLMLLKPHRGVSGIMVEFLSMK